jgi:hypothetical protein
VSAQGTSAVDRDYRSDEEIQFLRRSGVKVMEIAEVDNLVCIAPALKAVADHQGIENPEAVVQAAKKRVLDRLEAGLDDQVQGRAIGEIQFHLKRFSPTKEAIPAQLLEHVSSIQTAAILTRSEGLYRKVISDHDYDAALRYFNNKGIVAAVAGVFGMTPKLYKTTVAKIVGDEPAGNLAEEMRKLIT